MVRRMGRTKIEYGINSDGSPGRNWNPYPGCLHKPQGKCPVPNCWAEGMSKRQQADFHKPHLIPELLLAPLNVNKPSVILVNFMGDLFGDWVDARQDCHFTLPDGREAVDKLVELVLKVVASRPEHTFLFLTKNPAGLLPWGDFPDNAWVGISVCNQRMFDKAMIYLPDVEAKHKWLSIEPLLGEIKIVPGDLYGISWTVIGAQSSPVLYPKTDWVENIIWACLDAGIPVYLKKNLIPSLPPCPPFYVAPVETPTAEIKMAYRQERPS